MTKAAAVMRATREAHAQGMQRAKRKEKEGLDTSWAKTALRREKVASEEEEEEEEEVRKIGGGRGKGSGIKRTTNAEGLRKEAGDAENAD